MKKLFTGALFTGVMLVSGLAGIEIAAGKEDKTPVELPARSAITDGWRH